MTPMWKRQGWKPRPLGPADPLDEAAVLARQEGVQGVALIPLSLLKALVERRECGSLREFHADEDGPHSWTAYARCRVAEGHDGLHTNGYYRWENVDASDRSGDSS